jgi:hypothetical protein
MRKKSRKGKKRNIPLAQRAREQSRQIKGALRSTFINHAIEERKMPSSSARMRVARSLGINPADPLNADNQGCVEKIHKNYFYD